MTLLVMDNPSSTPPITNPSSAALEMTLYTAAGTIPLSPYSPDDAKDRKYPGTATGIHRQVACVGSLVCRIRDNKDLDRTQLNELIKEPLIVRIKYMGAPMLETIHAGKTASISEFKKNPQAIIDAAHGESIALLNRNKTTASGVSPNIYERLLEIAEDMELGRIFEERKHEMDDAIEVSIDEL